MSAITIFPLRRVLLAAAASAIVAAMPASAQTASSTLSVGAVVTDNCTVSTTAVDFGNVVVTVGGPRDGTGNLLVTCTNGTAWAATADAGQASGATPGARQMTDGADALDYALYTDNTRGTLWGDGTAGTAAMTGVGIGTVQNETIYASVLPGQTSVPAGNYADQINVTVTY